MSFIPTIHVISGIGRSAWDKLEITFCSRQDKPGKGGSYVVSGNHSMESSGFDSHPAKANHQPEASLACECGDAPLEA